MKTPSHQQLTAFLETTETSLDLTDFSKCIAYLYDENGGDVASIDFINSKEVCEGEIYIGEESYALTEKQRETVLNYLESVIQDQLQNWKEMKAEIYN